ncbi:MAG: YdcF family protein [Flavobacterium sp.]
MKVLFILLGCQIARLLNGRIQTAVDFVSKNHKNNSVDWFLSGGVKNGSATAMSEAEQMAQTILPYGSEKWSVILDTVATNTAENFVIANKTLNFALYSDVYVVTSEFHYGRAKRMTDRIFTNRPIKWVLSPLEERDSRYWETIHIRNVDADLERVIHIR